MRISDWSSDVCSSDLTDGVILAARPEVGELLRLHRVDFKVVGLGIFADDHAFIDRLTRRDEQDAAIFKGIKGIAHRFARPVGDKRSEEHTSELQSLMRISYDVFCLQKKPKQRQNISRTDKRT